MAATWISATEVTLTLENGTNLVLSTTDYSSALAPTVGSKPVIGAAYAGKVATQGDGTFSASGSGTIESMTELQAFRDPAAQPVAVTAVFGLGGTEAFNAFLDTVEITVTGDDEVEWSIGGDIDGTSFTYTPPA